MIGRRLFCFWEARFSATFADLICEEGLKDAQVFKMNMTDGDREDPSSAAVHAIADQAAPALLSTA
jgi:hypothetical protein